MELICLNAWGGRLYEPLSAFLEDAQPDILCLQEVVRSQADTGWLVYRDDERVLNQRADLFADVARILPDHTGFFCPSARGALWDDDTLVETQWGLATFVRRDIPVIGQIAGFVHGQFPITGFGQHPRPRNAHLVRLLVEGTPVTIAQMHGLRDPAGKMDTSLRDRQARRFAGMIGHLAAPEDVMIACGDFNVLPESKTFQILGELGLHDLVSAFGHAGTRTSHYEKPQKFADYMLTNAALDGVRFAVVRDPEVSDHCPLHLVLEPLE